MKKFESATQISVRRGIPLHRVQFIVKTRRIPPAMKVGNTNIFDAAGIRRIERALDDIEQRKALARSATRDAAGAA